MVISLNFSNRSLEEIARACSLFQEQSIGSVHEFKRWTYENTTVTLYHSGKLLIQGAQESRVQDLILSKLELGSDLILGIDEVGRGESFGNLVIAGVLGHSKDFLELRDSKKTPDIAKKADYVRAHALAYVIIAYTPQAIDELRTQGSNLNLIQAHAMDVIIEEMHVMGFSFSVKIDGSPLPVKSEKVEFIPKGDDLEPIIGAASVLAKSERDHAGNTEIRKTWNVSKK